MKKLLISLSFAALCAAGVAWSDDRLTLPQPVAPQSPAMPLGLPEMVWWVIGILVAAGIVARLAKLWPWLWDRLNEPSTHTATAVLLACGGLFLNSLSLEPYPAGQAMLLAGTVFAFLGLIGKDDKGPLL